MPDAPCKGCANRRVTESENCHMTCAAYQEFSRYRRRMCDANTFTVGVRAEHYKAINKAKKRSGTK
nr:MAG TPA: hypothetical protein [Caudoviricetes sp.]